MSRTVQEVIEKLIEPAGLRLESTVDTLKSGRLDAQVGKAAVAFTATYTVIRQAVEAGADLLVTHEPTYFNHLDDSSWFSEDPVYAKKRKLIEESGIAIFRLHDYIHRYRPDGILIGMLRKLEWESFADADNPKLLSLPDEESHTVGTVVQHLKSKLQLDSVQVAGNPEMPVKRLALLPGAPGGRAQMQAIGRNGVDLLIAGETSEWETNEYVRDAIDMGMAKALILTGHQKSEEAGMTTVMEVLRAAFPDLPVQFIDSPAAVTRM
ncbi:transcriptional regulator [Paenibacillus nanensis]|uniref:GTP cyclohydrolase 1 type 2 homolog n=1 Tax=Paenibacillus nanensis TaxID=393251 RepID=A0A3A1UMN0_9BACL|nr:Nif3-like dinuclear metal center hexameric protein [Paenibacillus nanensis]RIX49380.1 transcriptional regulator [Paenibacillus nanensis]